MADLSLRQFLKRNRFSSTSGVRHLLPNAAKGSIRYLLTTFVLDLDRLQPYQQLNFNDQLVSNNGLLNLIMQGDGNLVLYRTQFGHALWASNTGLPVDHVIMQSDGNLVAYSSQGTPYWDTGTAGHPGASSVLQDDGNFVVYDVANKKLWASNTVQDFSSPTFGYNDANGYSFVETSEWWKQDCTAFPCFAALHWPGYATQVVEDTINGQPVVIQLWKGDCQKFLGLPQFPGGIGAEVGVYRRMPGRGRPTSLPFFPKLFADFILKAIAALSDDQLWWAFPELNTHIDFTLMKSCYQPVLLLRRSRNQLLVEQVDERR